MIETLSKALKKHNIILTPLQEQQFETYYNLLIEWNEKMNLTAIVDEKEVAIKHFYDSITPLIFTVIKENAKVIDVGTGAGFPGIPLKILRPDINLTLLDSLNKRLIFLEEVLNKLNIQGDIIHMRAEEGGRNVKLREKFDIATSRAVANMNTLSEYLIPFVKKGGKVIVMKGKNGETELNKAKGGIKKLGGEVEKSFGFSLPTGDERTIIVINKAENTPKAYPRSNGKIKNSPLT